MVDESPINLPYFMCDECEECKIEWETNLRSCSQEMMAILSREYNKQITLLDTVITNLELALVLYAQHTLFLELQANLKENLLLTRVFYKIRKSSFGGTNRPSLMDKLTDGILTQFNLTITHVGISKPINRKTQNPIPPSH